MSIKHPVSLCVVVAVVAALLLVLSGLGQTLQMEAELDKIYPPITKFTFIEAADFTDAASSNANKTIAEIYEEQSKRRLP